MKNYLLTDFNTERWKGINIESVETQVEKLNEKINKIGCLFGEIGNPETFDVSLTSTSHSIKNLTFVAGKVYGDVEFLNNDNGKQADNFINNMNISNKETGDTELTKNRGFFAVENEIWWTPTDGNIFQICLNVYLSVNIYPGVVKACKKGQTIVATCLKYNNELPLERTNFRNSQ